MPSAVQNGTGAHDGRAPAAGRAGPADVVVTGLSGRLPESSTIEEFAQQLFDGVDLVTADDRRWSPGLHGLPERTGKLKNLSHFDAMFFGVHPKQAHLMDPQLRLLLEVTHEAIVDAGFNPAELRGSRTGVYVGVSNSESEEKWTEDPDKINGYALTGCYRAMFPNRISYTFDLKGPSYAIDTACSSSMFAFAQAVSAIRAGHCDAAIVAGTNLCLKPGNSLNFHRLSLLSPEGRCAAFDASGRGYVRAEAAVALVLQRRGAARRVYASVRAARMNTDGHKVQGITFPMGDMQRRLAKETFAEARLLPQDVVYFEAHGTGTKVGDPQEVNAIAKVFCKERKTPLLLGSVKSNMGHSEPASGLCSIAKVVIAMQRGVIPANLHYKTPNPDIPALSDGRIKVVDRNTAWQGGLVAVNSFGFGGANAHVILEAEGRMGERGAGKEGATNGSARRALPRLVVASGRTESAARRLLRHAAQHADSADLLALLDAVHARNVSGHPHRGYRLLLEPPIEEITEVDDGGLRPIWFVFSGMGSQWAGMARTLMPLPVFAASVERTAAALSPHGVDLLHVLTDAPDSAFDNVINSFTSIAAVQIALVDVLREVGIRPDGIVGHSVGEIGCAYADETLTPEQAVLAAYWRGRSIVDSALPVGGMAAVGLTWDECVARCPPGVVPACHNSNDSVTVSGPVEAVAQFVEQLSAEGVFARCVNSAGVAFHSEYIAAAAPLLRRSLEQVIPKPKPRSKKWLSTSLPKKSWTSDLSKLSNATYHVNNLLSPVLFAEVLQEVPDRALLVELAPHGLLQAVLKRAKPEAAHVPLLHRNSPDQLRHLLAAIGKIYLGGGQPQVSALYPGVMWPAGRDTPGLASAVEWDHGTEWSVAHFGDAARQGEIVFEFDLSRADDSFISDHNIDGQVIFPASGYLIVVWKALAKLLNKKSEDTPVVIENVKLKRATILSSEGPVRFLVNILPGSGEFELSEGGSVAVTGSVRLAEPAREERVQLPAPPASAADPNLVPLVADDVYKELRLRGYKYDGPFRGIRTSNALGTEGTLAWDDNWISFMDTMLQFYVIGDDTRLPYLLTSLERVHIDSSSQDAAVKAANDAGVPIHVYRDIDVVVAGGVELRGIKWSIAPPPTIEKAHVKLENYMCIPYDNSMFSIKETSYSKRDALTVCLQLALENASSPRLKLLEVTLDRAPDALLTPHVLRMLDIETQVRVDAVLAAGTAGASYKAAVQDLGIKISRKDAHSGTPDVECELVLAADVVSRHGAGVLANLAGALAANGALLLEEPRGALNKPASRDMLRSVGLVCAARQMVASCEYLLLRRTAQLPPALVLEVPDDDRYEWLEPLRVALRRAEAESLRVYLVSRAPSSGLLGLGTCLRCEPGGGALRIYYLPNCQDQFAPEAPTFAQQVKLDLAFNVLRAGVWGSYRHLPLADSLDTQLQVEHAYVNTLTRGDLSSLRWIESDLRYAREAPPPPGTDLCRVYYASLNFRDIMLASGRLRSLPGNLPGQDCILGMEFSGRSSSGKRVMGVLAAQGLATTVLADEGFLWEVPTAWSLEEAATVPVVYAIAYYALAVRGRMTGRDSVLVHAGNGAIGQAAISIALHAGCRVFTTVSSPEKRAFLLERFPMLPADDIGSSGDTSFEQLVRRRTGGRGVDIVLNSLKSDMLLASVRCLAFSGRFLEIGKLDLSNITSLDNTMFLKNCTFHGILMDALFDGRREDSERAMVVRCVAAGIVSGAVRPLPATVFSDQQLQQAFRFMATGKHIGKVMLRVREEESGGSAASVAARLVSACPRAYMHPGKSYVLVGGLGGFGLELAQWAVGRGARRLVFNSRSGVRSGYQAWVLRRLRARGVRIALSTHDASSPSGARALLAVAADLGPIGGVFNLAAVLCDALLDAQTPDNFRAVAKHTLDATKALDEATRALAPKLEYFVVFSSVSCGRGNAGQSNYGLANSAMERIVEQRQADGLPGLAVQWGTIGDSKFTTEKMVVEEDNMIGGIVPQRIASCMEAVGALLALPQAVIVSVVESHERRTTLQPQQGLVYDIANILGIKDLSKISESTNLVELGMDSLMGAEIKQTLQRVHDLVLGVDEIHALTFGKLKELSSTGNANGIATPHPPHATPAADLMRKGVPHVTQ